MEKELRFGKFRILVNDTGDFRSAIVIETQPSSHFKQQISKFVNAINIQIKANPALKSQDNFEMLSLLMDSYLEQFFYTHLLQPHKIGQIDKLNLTKVENLVLKEVKSLQNAPESINQFLIDQLLSAWEIKEVLSPSGVTKEQFLQAIYDLCYRKILIPVSREKKIMSEASKNLEKLELERLEKVEQAEKLFSKEKYIEAAALFDEAILIAEKLGAIEDIPIYKSKSETAKSIAEKLSIEIALAESEKLKLELNSLLEKVDELIEDNQFKKAGKTCRIISKLFEKLGDGKNQRDYESRANYFETEADNLKRQAMIEGYRIERDTILQEISLKLASEQDEEALKLFRRAAKLSEEMGELDIAEGFNEESKNLEMRINLKRRAGKI